MSAGVIFQQMVVIFLLILVGYVLFKWKILAFSCSADLSALVVQLCSPALIIVSALEGCHNLKHDQVIWGFVLVGGLYLLLILLGLVIPGLLRSPGCQYQQYNMMTVFGNTGFIGIPVVMAVLGADAMVYVTIFNIYFNLLIYTYGIYLVNKDGGKEQQKLSPQIFLNVGNVSNVIAILIFLLKPEVPMIAQETVNYVGDATVFLSMVIVGGFLAKAPLREIFSEKRIYVFVLARQIIVPILLTVALKPWVTDPMMLGACMLMVAMPVGNMPLLMAEQAGVDGKILSKGIIVTTLGSMVTVPLVALFMS